MGQEHLVVPENNDVLNNDNNNKTKSHNDWGMRTGIQEPTKELPMANATI